MTFLKKRFIEDLQLHGYSQRTVDAYVRAVRQLAEHYHKSPDKITEEELRQYFLYNKNIRKWSRVASTISLCGIKFFFEKTLHKEWTTFKLVRPPKEKKLPPILSLREVRAILNNTRMDYHRACLTASSAIVNTERCLLKLNRKLWYWNSLCKIQNSVSIVPFLTSDPI